MCAWGVAQSAMCLLRSSSSGLLLRPQFFLRAVHRQVAGEAGLPGKIEADEAATDDAWYYEEEEAMLRQEGRRAAGAVSDEEEARTNASSSTAPSSSAAA